MKTCLSVAFGRPALRRTSRRTSLQVVTERFEAHFPRALLADRATTSLSWTRSTEKQVEKQVEFGYRYRHLRLL